ncbi:MAG: IMP cyclohydrolase [Candidatus Bathyarchaeota archaeon]|nr:IMP cyclohydrolase [Candidatus Bathyarchaeota archaeon]
MITRRRALISVYDKTGLLHFARELNRLGFEIVASSGTFTVLKNGGVQLVKQVSDLTNVPEILDGRVKTLHPKLIGGILALRDKKEHMNELTRLNIKPIDVVVCNFYPLERINGRNLDLQTFLNSIDIGGPSLIRAAAKNFPHVVVIVDPERYGQVLQELKKYGNVTIETKSALAIEAFHKTASYDHSIYRFFKTFVTTEDR